MPLAAMSSFLVSFRETGAVGLASQTIDCEWASEIDHAGGAAQTARLTLTPGETVTITPAPGGLRALAVKSVSGAIDVSSAEIEAHVRPGGSACWSSSTPAPAGAIQISSSDAGAVAEVVVISDAGA